MNLSHQHVIVVSTNEKRRKECWKMAACHGREILNAFVDSNLYNNLL